MLLSYKWLSEFVTLPVSPEQLADVLTWLGLEVEAVHTYAPNLDNVVIGEILECAPIEGTNHLSLTKTRVGGETLSIVCGAPNARAGLKVVAMLAGSKTAEGMVIKKAKLRGQESHGMLASEQELGLAPSHAGIIECPADWEVGAPAAKYLQDSDTVYDVEITPNRPDFLSHIGVARDIAAKFKLPWKPKSYDLNECVRKSTDFVRVKISAPVACPRYLTRGVTGVKIAPAPYEVQLRLLRCGVRPISNVVDVTNYLMLETGQPLHAFDARYIADNSIDIRFAGAGESFVTLDEKEHKLQSHDLLIADSKHGIALAGIMGGLNSEIREDTTDVVIECAYFDPVHVRRTAKSLGMSTDSSRRFERGCDPNQVPYVAAATAALIQQWGGGEVLSGVVDDYPRPIVPVEIAFRPEKTEALIGVQYDFAEIEDTLTRLGCEVSAHSSAWTVKAPTHRPDLEREVDLIEEIVRVQGYDQIPTSESSKVVLTGKDDPVVRLRRQVEDILVAQGFLQTVSLSMWNPEPRLDPPGLPAGVEVANPVTDEMKYLQGSVLAPMLRAAAANFERGDRDLRLFETTRVFREGVAGDPRTWEKQVVAGLLVGRRYPSGWSQTKEPSDFFDLKSVLEFLALKLSLDKPDIFCYDLDTVGFLSGQLRVGEQVAGDFGLWPREVCAARDIDASVAWFELDLSVLAANRRSEFAFEPLPRFPIAWRDLSVVLDHSVPFAELVSTVRGAAGNLLQSVWPFDVFVSDKLGVGKKSVAFRLEFLHPERSLDAAEVDAAIQSIVTKLQQEHSAELR
ncbi:MAG: phenylalanine--tRNA ligase subunit beta [Calditrichaeota bacterium]|nr:phenylalanine--tRNA ligase subunit beta [Calditrichota bacterium]MCB9366326.1 phenylalanine--tRNA ligase subunit beta [Calditrichota bacterium]